MKTDKENEVISEEDARAIVMAIKAGSVEVGVKAIVTIVEVSQQKVMDEVKLQLSKKRGV